jgi:hypothetical protein
MGTFSAMLLSAVLAADGEPLSADELKIGVAALEESLSRYTAIEATYSVHHEFKPNRSRPAGIVPPDPATVTWIWTNSREFVSMEGADARGPVTTEVLFDGEKNYRSEIFPSDSEYGDRVYILPGPPDADLMMANYLSFFTGHRLFLASETPLSLVAKAKSEETLSGKKSEQRWTIFLGSLTVNRVDYDYEVELDAASNFRLSAIRWKESDGAKDGGSQWEFVVDDFQSVVDEASGQQVWFPLKGRFDMPGQITHVEVASVRINHPIPSEKLVWRQPKIGTEVSERTVPGGRPKIWTVGGAAAEEARMKKLVEQAQSMAESERERLDAEGVRTEAALPSHYGRWLWLGGGCLLLISAWILSRYVNRRTG